MCLADKTAKVGILFQNSNVYILMFLLWEKAEGHF